MSDILSQGAQHRFPALPYLPTTATAAVTALMAM